MKVLHAPSVLPSPARVDPPGRAPVRIGAVQQRWHADPEEHRAALAEGVAAAAEAGAELVCLQELTLSQYFAIAETPVEPVIPEPLTGGPTFEFAAALAAAHDVAVHASLYEDAGDGGIGFNTAIVVGPDGALLAHTRKLHIPITAGYYEDRYFRPGDTGFPVVDLTGARFGFPTCWDQWFPEVARAYSLAGAEVLVYPTAIGSEPDHPDFDTQPLWQQVIVGNGIANGLFMVVPNRTGSEPKPDGTPGNTFYGCSFVSDPYGRVLAQAPRDEPCVLVVDLDLAQRQDWLDLFPFLATRRPDTYAALTKPVDAENPYGGA